jgi:hypothetical protein
MDVWILANENVEFQNFHIKFQDSCNELILRESGIRADSHIIFEIINIRYFQPFICLRWFLL